MTKLATAGQSGMRKIDSGPAVSSLNIGVEAMLNLKKQLMSTSLSNYFSLYLKNVDSIYKPELYGEYANIQVGSPNAESSFTFNADDINGEYNVEVIFNEGVFDMPTKINSAMQMKEAGLISKRTARQMCNIRLGEDEDKLIALEQEQEIQYQARLSAAQNGEIQAPPMTSGLESEQGMGGPIMDQLMQAGGQGMPANPMDMMSGAGGGMPPELAGMQGGMPPELAGMQGGMPPEMAAMQGGGMPPELAGMQGGGMPEMPGGPMPEEGGIPMSPDLASPAAGMDEEEINAKLESITNLKGEAILVGIQGDKIIIALEDMSDKKTIIDAMPEYKGQLEFINLTEDMQ